MQTPSFLLEAILETDQALARETLTSLEDHIADGQEVQSIVEPLLVVSADTRAENSLRSARARYALSCIFLHFEQARLNPKDPLPLKAQRIFSAVTGRFEIEQTLMQIALHDHRSSVRGQAIRFLAYHNPLLLRNSMPFISQLPALLDGHDRVVGTAAATALKLMRTASPDDPTLESIRANRVCTSGAWNIREMLAELDTTEADKEE